MTKKKKEGGKKLNYFAVKRAEAKRDEKERATRNKMIPKRQSNQPLTPFGEFIQVGREGLKLPKLGL